MEIYSDNNRKIKYKEYCESHKEIPVFIHPWWLDQEVGENGWDVILLSANNNIIGALPFCHTKLKIFSGIGMPFIAPYQGHFITYPKGQYKSASKLAWEEKAVKLLYTNLPKNNFHYLHFFPEITNWISLSWLGYKQTTKYSFLINGLSDTESVFNNFEKRARNTIRKAENQLTIKSEKNSQHLISLTKVTYAKQKLAPPYELSKLTALTEASIKKQLGQIYTVFDSKNTPQASAFVVWDRETAYYTIQSSSPESLNNGGASLLVWHAIKEASKAGLQNFDFTGSMMPNIAKYIRSFGAIPQPRHYIWKENNAILYWMMRVKEFLNRNK